MSDSASIDLGRHILIWGGGGKTTLSRALGQKLDLPVIELDAINWLPNWEERETDEFVRLAVEAIDKHPDGWVVDGNYGGKLAGEILGRVDTLIWIELPWRVIFWRTFWRAIARARDRRLICGQNIESWRHTFCSRDSLLWFYIKLRFSPAWKDRHVRREERIAEFGRQAAVIHLDTAQELNDFYSEHGLIRPAGR